MACSRPNMASYICIINWSSIKHRNTFSTVLKGHKLKDIFQYRRIFFSIQKPMNANGPLTNEDEMNHIKESSSLCPGQNMKQLYLQVSPVLHEVLTQGCWIGFLIGLG